MFYEMVVMMTVLYKINTPIWMFIVLSQVNSSQTVGGQLEHIILIHSQTVYYLFLLCTDVWSYE